MRKELKLFYKVISFETLIWVILFIGFFYFIWERLNERLNILKNELILRVFFLKFNVLYMGSLCLILLFLSAIIARGRLESGTGFVWDSQYLNSSFVVSSYLLIFFISILSYLFALWKTWKLTKSATILNKTRIIAFGWLFGAPIFLYFSLMFWISLIRIFTDRLFFWGSEDNYF